MQNNILQTLSQLMQKNRADEQVAPPPLPGAPPPVQYQRPQSAPMTMPQASQAGLPGLGFLGGLGDSQNQVTGVVDPSIITQLNQYIMKQAGGQQLPWQTTSAQNSGAALSKLLGIK